MSSTNQTTGVGRPHIVALCGSRRKGSHTRKALEVALTAVRDAGGSAELVDLSEMELPPLDPDQPEAGDSEHLTRIVHDADAVILGTPMYHGSYSGVLKNAIDYCGFDEFEGKTIGLLVVSGGPFPTPALTHLRDVCRSLKAWVLPHQVAIPRARSAFDGGQITDNTLEERIHTLGTQLVHYCTIEPNTCKIDVPL